MFAIFCNYSSNSQYILNGSFENNSLQNCLGTFYYAQEYVEFIADSYPISIPAFEINIYHDSCNYMNGQDYSPAGYPDGQYGVTLNAWGQDDYMMESGFSLRLSSPLIIGQTYALSFYKIKQEVVVGEPAHQYHEPSRVQIGLSNNTYSFGEQIYLAEKANSIEWEYDAFEFSPDFGAEHITVQAVPELGLHAARLDHFTLTIVDSVNESDFSTQTSLKISPNPSSGFVNITLSEEVLLPLEIHIVNPFGQLVQKEVLYSVDESVNFSYLSPGVYYLSAEGVRTQKVIIQ